MEYRYKSGELKTFFFFMNERHRIWCKRKAKEKWPWTKDKILKTYKFTNVFRQLDRVTEEWTNRWIRLLHRGKNMSDGEILFHLCMFRFFNWPDTYDALYYGMKKWNLKKAVDILQKRIDEDFEQIFTGAYIITAAGRSEPKHVVICEALDYVYKNKDDLAERVFNMHSMEYATDVLQEVPTQGPFTSYEVICDLRHTRLLQHARDVNSWANAGPGAKRGIHRLLTGEKTWKGYDTHKTQHIKKPDYNAVMHDLLERFKEDGMEKHIKECDWPFEMREIEHSLCEFDKYRRVQKNEGRPRSLYRPKLNDEHKELQKNLPWD